MNSAESSKRLARPRNTGHQTEESLSSISRLSNQFSNGIDGFAKVVGTGVADLANIVTGVHLTCCLEDVGRWEVARLLPGNSINTVWIRMPLVEFDQELSERGRVRSAH